MAIMPTTRQGRFKFYRNRQLRRLKRVRGRTKYLGAPGNPGSHHVTTRELDISDFTVQNPRVYPLTKNYVCAVNASIGAWDVRPGRGRWGVPTFTAFTLWGWGPNTHADRAFLGYQLRRVKSIPRLKHLPVKPYALPMFLVDPVEFYQLQYYPSGRLNPNWTP